MEKYFNANTFLLLHRHPRANLRSDDALSSAYICSAIAELRCNESWHSKQRRIGGISSRDHPPDCSTHFTLCFGHHPHVAPTPDFEESSEVHRRGIGNEQTNPVK
jgi:hypothetical protein